MAAAGSARVTYTLDADGIGMAQTARVKGTPHVIQVDAVPAFGGKDAAPGPLAYALAAFSSCSQATAMAVSRLIGIPIEKIHFDVKSEIDLGLLVGAPITGRPDFQFVDMEVTVHTNASDADLERLRAETEARCPVYQLFHRSGVPLRSRWRRA